jgi:uncharacterized DUF497 family protein
LNFNFEWDPVKARTNFEKHKISFENAATVFADPMTLTIFDVDHSEIEDRWITIGISGNGNIIVVVHTFKAINENNAIIRINSARKATKNEMRQYKDKIL